MMSLSLEESLSLPVVLPSGEALPVRFRFSDPVAWFPRQVADQFRFNPRLIDRFRFHARHPSEWDEDTPLSGWMSVSRMNGTWRDLFLSEKQLPPHLFLVIAEESPVERQEKIGLIRSLLPSGGMEVEDAVLYEHYRAWWLRSTVPYSNRYEAARAFVSLVAS
jgi:hypothetical protein